jgi:hypothetical protein
MTKSERAQLNEAMKMIREINERFGSGPQTQAQDCGDDRELRRKWNTADDPDRDFGLRANEFHRGGKPNTKTVQPRTVANDSEESYEALIARYRRQMLDR